jgi:hypothetical protein
MKFATTLFLLGLVMDVVIALGNNYYSMYERLNVVNNSDVIDWGKFRVKKLNRTITALDGNITLLEELNNDWQVSEFSSPIQ